MCTTPSNFSPCCIRVTSSGDNRRLPRGASSNKRTRDVLGTVALSAIGVVLGSLMVAAYVWVVPLAVQLLVSPAVHH